MFPKSTKILIVDDMAMFRAMVKQALTEMEYTKFTEASNGEAAWLDVQKNVQEKTPYQLIISDWTMPKMKGIELLKKVRAESWGANFPFILLTGETEKDLIMEALQANVSGYIIKPFTPQQLKDKMKIAFDRVQAVKSALTQHD